MTNIYGLKEHVRRDRDLSDGERDFLLAAIEGRDLVRRLVKETPFTPSSGGLDLHISFEFMRELQEVIKS